MFEQQTAIKNFDKSCHEEELRELRLGSPSLQQESSPEPAGSHQTSISSFDPDSYRADAFNIAALLKADCVVRAEQVTETVIQVVKEESQETSESPQTSMVIHQKNKQSLTSDFLDSQSSQRTNTVDPAIGGFNNQHMVSEICPQTEKKSNYSSLYCDDKVSVPFEHEAKMNQSIVTMEVGIEETVKKVMRPAQEYGIIEERTPTSFLHEDVYIEDGKSFDTEDDDQD